MIKRITAFILILGIILSLGGFTVFSADTPFITYDFETDSEGWVYWNSINGSKYTYTVEDAYLTGSKALLITDLNKTSGAGIQSPKFDVTVGETYTVAASSYVISGTVSMYLRFYDSNNTQIASQSATFDRAPWIEKAVTLTVPENAVTGRIIICTTTAAIAGAYLDNVNVYKGSYTAKGELSGTVPETLPEIKEEDENYEVLDDGYENGQVIFFESFEEGIGTWRSYVNKSSYSIDKKNSTHGDYSLHINDTSDTLSGGVLSEKIAVAQGNTYTIHTDLYNPKPGVALYVRLYNSENTMIQQATLNFPATGWRYGRTSIKATEGAVFLELLYASGIAAMPEMYIDNIRVIKGADIIKREETAYSAPEQAAAVDSQIIAPVNNKLQYNAYNEEGDKLSDYSYAGYYGGEVNLPDTAKLPLSATLSPSGSDDTERLQAAIDEASAKFAKEKLMQVVKLKKGTYYVNEAGLNLKSGVLISGEGQGPNGTIIHSTSTATDNIMTADGGAVKRISDYVNITDDYVKAGSKTVTLADASKFKVGDTVCIYHPSTQEWIDALKMSNVNTVYGDTLSWKAGDIDNKTYRKIVAIDGNTVTFDYGMFIPYDKTYAQSYVYAVDFSNLIQDLGVENLRVTSQFNGDPYDNNHAKMAIYVKRTRNMFVRNITAKNLYNGVFGCRADSSQITVLNCSNLEPVSTIEGGNRYPFYADVHTEKILFSGCYSYDGRHDYMAVKGTSGPVVFSDSIVDMGNACSETHAGFATGVLYENLYHVTDRSSGYIGFPNRGLYGTDSPQGWTAAGCVAWNCLSNSIIVNKPLLSYQNFTVGVWGIYNTDTSEEVKKLQSDGYQYDGYRYEGVDVGPDSAFATKSGTSMVGDGYKEAEFTPVNPRSVFKAQLSERFTGSIKNAKPNAPVIIYPRPDKEVSKADNQVSVNGIYEKGATAVYVYVDDEKLTATLNKTNYTFDSTLSLSEGVHKIYATQVIDGIEGNKSADRFIIVGTNNGENPDYLQSNYPVSTLSLIANDTRPDYVEYMEDSGLLPLPYDGEGTDEAPYILDSLEKFLKVFANGSKADLSKVYLLTGFDETAMELPYDYKPLGVAFTGKLIGGNMTDGKLEEKIQKINFNITTDKATAGVDYIVSDNSNKVQGILFHKLDGATVKNLMLTGSVITVNTPSYLGTLSGHAKASEITNVHNYASIDGDQQKGTGGLIGWTGSSVVITDCSNHGNITVPDATTARYDVGGIVGYMTSTTLLRVFNYGDIQGRDNAGGIAGYSNCNISDCGNYGNISVTRTVTYGYAGGISGRTNGGNISRCFNAGNITSPKYAGGILAHIPSGKTVAIENCFNVGMISGETAFGLLIGINMGSADVRGFYDMGNPGVRAVAGENTGTVTFSDCFALSEAKADATETEIKAVGADYIKKLMSESVPFSNSDVWVITENYPYPNLKNSPFEGLENGLFGEGTEEKPYRIYLGEELRFVNSNPAAHFILMADISGVTEMLCTEAPFTGSFDGNGKTIEILLDTTEITEYPKYVGLFHTASGVISNLNIKGSVNAGFIDWQGGAAAFAGKATEGFKITDCKNYASVTSTGHQTAGIVGNNNAGAIEIIGCINYGDITAGEKASGIAGVIASSTKLQRCGNYGNITGVSIASGISSWVYTWQWLDSSFNVGTITATKENGVACGLYGGLVTSSNAKNIQKCFNAGNLSGDVTYGIAQISDGGSKAIKLQYCYNAVYADYPLINKTETNTYTVGDCFYLAETEADGIDNTTAVTKDALKSKTLSGFSVSGNYQYPQITVNPIDEDRDNIDFSLVTIKSEGEHSDISSDTYKALSFYVVKGKTISFKISVEPYFYLAELTLNGEILDKDISESREYNIDILTDTVLALKDKTVSAAPPKTLGIIKAITSGEGGSLTVGEAEYDSYALIAAKTPKITGLKLKESGIYTSRNEAISQDSYQHKFTASKDKVSESGAFGILLYNMDKNHLVKGKSYYVIPYGIYEDINGEEYLVTGEKTSFIFN